MRFPKRTSGLMHILRWSPQKPERRLSAGKKKLAADKKTARMGAHIVFADESGFQLIPNVVQTWAPQGQTPIHRHRQGKREKISVISGISVSPKRHHLGLYYLLFLDNIGQEEVCLFLQEVLRHLRGPVIVLLDNSSTHQGAPLQKLLDQNPRLQVEHFPSYAPELNPDEGVWALAKRALANSCPDNADELMEDIIRSINSIRTSPAKLRGCVLQSELPSFLR
jgi:transposase